MVWDFLGDIGFLVEEIIVVIIIATLTYLMNYFRLKSKDSKKLDKKLVKLSLRQNNLQKVFVLMAKLIDDQSKRAHPDVHTELEGIIKEMLMDSILTNGNRE